MRDPNLRVYMENLVKDSPMFEFAEQSAGREVRAPLEKSQSDSQPHPQIPMQNPAPQMQQRNK
jgi:hypothetical protein